MQLSSRTLINRSIPYLQESSIHELLDPYASGLSKLASTIPIV